MDGETINSRWNAQNILFKWEKNEIKDKVLLEITDPYHKTIPITVQGSVHEWRPENFGEYSYKIAYSDDLIEYPLEWSKSVKFSILPPSLHKTLSVRFSQLFSNTEIEEYSSNSESKGSLTAIGLNLEYTHHIKKIKNHYLWTQAQGSIHKQKGIGKTYYLPSGTLNIHYSWESQKTLFNYGPFLSLSYTTHSVFFNLYDSYINASYEINSQKTSRFSPGLGFYISQPFPSNWLWFASALLKVDTLGKIIDPDYGKQLFKGSLGYELKTGAYLKGPYRFLWNGNLKLKYTQFKWDRGQSSNLTFGAELGAAFSL